MPITCNYQTLAQATGLPDCAALMAEMAGAAEFLAARPAIDQFRDAFIGAFQRYFSIEFRVRTHPAVDPVLA